MTHRFALRDAALLAITLGLWLAAALSGDRTPSRQLTLEIEYTFAANEPA